MKNIIEALGLKEEHFITEVGKGHRKRQKYVLPTCEISVQEEVSEVLHRVLLLDQTTSIRLTHSFNRSALKQIFTLTSFEKEECFFSFNDGSLVLRVMPKDYWRSDIFGYLWFEDDALFLKFENFLSGEVETFTFEFTF